MPNIKPISDLRNYNEVLHDVAVGAPVFLTKSGRGKYAIVDIQDYEKTQATLRLMKELAKGRKSAPAPSPAEFPHPIRPPAILSPPDLPLRHPRPSYGSP